MWKFYFSSLRSRAVVLVLIAIFPLLLLTLYSNYDLRNRDIREKQTDGLSAVRNLATTLETVINDNRNLLTILSQLRRVQRRDRHTCNTLFAELLKHSPQNLSIVATDPEGQLFASAPAVPGPINFADRQWFQKVAQTKELVIGETIMGRVSGKYGVNLAYPILDDAGSFKGALSTQLDLHWLGSLLSKSEFPPDTAMTLTDSTWKVLFRYPEPQKYIGQTVPDSLVKAMTISNAGVAAGIDLSGKACLFAYTRLPPPMDELRLTIALPTPWALGPANRALWRNLFILGLVGLFAMAAAWFGGNLFIVQPVKKLQAVSERLAAGDLTVRSGSDYTQGELGLLSRSFDQMADALQDREADLRRSEARLRLALNAAKAGAWEWDLQTNENFWSEELWSLYGLLPHSVRPSNEAWLQTVHPDDRAKTEDAVNTVAFQSTELEIEWRVQRPNGGICWLISRGQPQLDGHGQPVRYFGIVMDITRRKEAEEDIRFLTHELMRTQEQERHKIALELHDTVAQELATLIIGLENLRRNSPALPAAQVSSQLTDLLGILRQSLKSIRTISYNLRPPNLKHLGLVEATQLYCEEVAARTGLHIDFKAAGIENKNLDYETAINLYRIIQEGLTNVWRHAQAENVSIRLVASYPKIIVRVEDDGQGFEVAEPEASDQLGSRMGLLGMKERVGFLGGEIQLESEIKRGTRIKIQIPWTGEGHDSNEKDSSS
jgi:PAS domain S-box-containing protein